MGGAQWESAARCGEAETRTLLRRAGDRAAYLALRGVWAVLGRATLGHTRHLLESVAGIVGRVDRHHRRVIEENLAIAFPSMDGVVRDSVVEASFRNWGRIGAEALHCDEIVTAAEGIPEWEAVRIAVGEGLASGRGLLVLTAHTGNFELLARIFGKLVAPVAVFHRPLGVGDIDGFLLRERDRFRVTTLGRGASVRDALRILSAGGCVAVPLDQNQRDGRGIFIDVLGHPACTSTMLARLSLASGAPVLPVFAMWDGDRTMPFVTERIVPPPGKTEPGERELVLRELTRRYAADVDRVVRRFPHQWNWAHRRWKTRPPAATDDVPDEF